jgi:hypothetical protein
MQVAIRSGPRTRQARGRRLPSNGSRSPHRSTGCRRSPVMCADCDDLVAGAGGQGSSLRGWRASDMVGCRAALHVWPEGRGLSRLPSIEDSSGGVRFEVRVIGRQGQVSVGRTSETAYTYEYSVEGRRLRLGAPIFYGSPDDPGKRLGGWRARGSQCALDGPPATYAWSIRKGTPLTRVNGNRRFTDWLVLRARNERCEPRGRIVEGVWEALGP